MKIIAHKYYQFKGHKNSIYALASGMNPQQFYTSGADGLIASWDLQSKADGQIIAKVDASVYAMHFHPTKNLLIIGQNQDGLHFYDVEKQKISGSIKLTNANIFDIKSVGDDIWVACGDGMLYVIDQLKRQVKKKLQLSSSSLRSISINKEGSEVAVAASDYTIYLINGNEITPYKEHSNSVFKVLFAPDGKNLLSGSRDAQLKIWNLNNGAITLDENIPAHLFTINDIVMSPDQKYLASASKDKTIKIWDFQNRKLLKVIDHARSGGHTSSVNKLIWSSFENLLVSVSDDRTICAWDLEFNH